ncbi:MAG: bifunctional demethylmenaquinone methyltransferase/2-methoxy-6-polyprenyl-1,4-benzoquinol methylase UbiE [Bacteroidales bacterium]|jgi:demethylmenaquinone methyltransferase/2-methoxy-6-polyprenyl-1,4-benzoquinol methylase|nr:bifunctional demethylmenaquinone methyltransferase/2-methoxy-6-polyprenyl-1,4-benzoquinol methylase UbiE [Bacteroidales bacterium]MDD4058537.1 bifunctional demethylmenaquinone methyltransferase/2-methoxy-6-polyprenyl-1,4-benzoquinol methylase UbiE [Bacteroidales bacterium]
MSQQISKERNKISAMFNGIAGSYDFLNHLLSLGIDRHWRRVLIKHVLKRNPNNALDIATGTGDIAIALYKVGVETTGIDIADQMVEVAKSKCSKLKKSSIPLPGFLIASADDIPYPDNSFQLVTIGFGIRNFENRKRAIEEIFRVLKVGGELAILEFAEPRNKLWSSIYKFYFHNILPLIGKLISKDMDAYRYLPESVSQFPQYKDFCNELETVGFANPKFKPLTGGVSILYTALKT